MMRKYQASLVYGFLSAVTVICTSQGTFTPVVRQVWPNYLCLGNTSLVLFDIANLFYALSEFSVIDFWLGIRLGMVTIFTFITVAHEFPLYYQALSCDLDRGSHYQRPFGVLS